MTSPSTPDKPPARKRMSGDSKERALSALRRWRAVNTRIDYAPSVAALEVIRQLQARNANFPIGMLIDYLVVRGDRVNSGNGAPR